MHVEMNALGKYIHDKHMDQTEFADATGVAPSTVSLWVAGQRIPDLNSALAIQRVTKGAIPVEYWEHREPVAPKSKADAGALDDEPTTADPIHSGAR